MGDETGTEIAVIEQAMRSDYRAYHNDPGMQARYGELLEARAAAGAPEPRAASALDTEIAHIQDRMRTDFRGYEGDPAMQARYLELLEAQEIEAAAPSPAAPKQGHFQPPAARAPARAASAAPAGGGHAEARPTADVMAEFATEPETAALLKGWGADAEANVAHMTRESTDMLNAMPLEDALEAQAFVDAMSPAGRAHLYRHLADAGRARGTR